jgi:magnesium transporter
MILSFRNAGGRLVSGDGPQDIAPDAVWFDLSAPDADEEARIGRLLGIELPTREEREEIEVSSRLYAEDGALVMTAQVLAQADSDSPLMAPVSFVLSQGRLVTIRDHSPRSFDSFLRRAQRMQIGCTDGASVLVQLLDEVIDRLADVLERVAREVDALSRHIFTDAAETRPKGEGYRAVLKDIGRKGDLVSNLRESLVTLDRLASFLEGHSRAEPGLKANRDQIRALGADVRALSDHADFLGQKINFLLDATLGFITIQQNGIMQLFSVVAVVFLPPTLVASIYGMNFEVMPELAWPWGYPLALAVMVATAVGPYLWFKHRGWL